MSVEKKEDIKLDDFQYEFQDLNKKKVQIYLISEIVFCDAIFTALASVEQYF